MQDPLSLRVHFLHSPDPSAIEVLKARLDPAISVTCGLEPPNPAEFQVLIAGRPSRQFLTITPKLKILIIPFAGIPEETRVLMSEFPDVEVYNLHHNAAATAEMAIALLLAAAKRLLPIDRQFREHDWSPRYHSNPSTLLEGKKALVLGYGEIGRRIAKFCAAFGMEVHAVRRSIDNHQEVDSVSVHPVHELHSLLQSSHVLILSVPSTPETDGMISKEELSLLPQGAILVNVARGKIVDERALYQSLKSGHLLAAGIDVWYEYPKEEESRTNTPPSKYPFNELDNLVMSPHRAGGWRESEQARMCHLAQVLNSVLHGEELKNRVDILRGY
ncbi:MAG: hydroxyacid dehydrogenase [Anaerolineales bacterium]|nr:hydroxyacid dehydrogenase [Anaerolineales bacterium]